MTCLLSHNSQCTLYCSAICWCSLKNLHNQLQCMYEATSTLPTNKCLFVIFLTYIKVIYFRTSPSSILSSSSSYWSGNNSLLSSSVMLFVLDSSPSDSAMSSSLFLFDLKAETMSLPLLVKTLKNLLHGIWHSGTILWSNSAILTPVSGDGNLSAMQIEWRSFDSDVKKCAVSSRKDNVTPGFDQISAHILMIMALLNNNRIVSCRWLYILLISWETPFQWGTWYLLCTEFFTIN